MMGYICLITHATVYLCHNRGVETHHEVVLTPRGRPWLSSDHPMPLHLTLLRCLLSGTLFRHCHQKELAVIAERINSVMKIEYY